MLFSKKGKWVLAVFIAIALCAGVAGGHFLLPLINDFTPNTSETTSETKNTIESFTDTETIRGGLVTAPSDVTVDNVKLEIRFNCGVIDGMPGVHHRNEDKIIITGSEVYYFKPAVSPNLSEKFRGWTTGVINVENEFHTIADSQQLGNILDLTNSDEITKITLFALWEYEEQDNPQQEPTHAIDFLSIEQRETFIGTIINPNSDRLNFYDVNFDYVFEDAKTTNPDYTFEGWYLTDNRQTFKVANAREVLTRQNTNPTVVGRWRFVGDNIGNDIDVEKTFRIRFATSSKAYGSPVGLIINPNGNEIVIGTHEYFLSEYTFEDATTTDTNYSFKGWQLHGYNSEVLNTEDVMSLIIGDEIENIDEAINTLSNFAKIVTVVAIWEPNE